jgi:N-acetylneuraminic acid mutarotase
LNGKEVYIFGGTDGKTFFNDVYIFNIENYTFSKLKTKGSIPTVRSGHSSVFYNNSIYIFGGGTGKYYLFFYKDEKIYNDIIKFDIDTLSWKNIISLSKIVPISRVHHTGILFI